MVAKRISRRDFIRLAAISAAGASLVACGGGQQQQTQAPAGEQEPAAPAAGETPDTTVRVGDGKVYQYWYAWGNFDPAVAKIAETDMFKTAMAGHAMEYKGQVTNEAILTAIAAGTPPDGGSNFDYPNLFTRGAAIAVDNMVAGSQVFKKEEIVEQIWDSCFINGQMIGVPGIESYLWWGLNYNAAAAEAAGLDPAAPPLTWEEATDWHKALTKFDDAGNIQQIGLDPYDAMAGETDFAAQSFMGKNWWDEANKKFDFNNEAFAQSFETMGEFYRIVGPDKMAGMRQVEGQGGWGASFNAGVQTMIIEGYWHPGETQIQKPDMAKNNRATWAPVPASRAGAKIMATGAHMVQIFKEGKNQEGMFKFAEVLVNDEALDIIFKEVGWIFGKKSYLAKVDPNAYPGLDFYIKAAEEATEWIIGRRSPVHNFVQTQYIELRERVFRNEMTGKEAAAEMQTRAEAEWQAQGLG